MEEHGCRTLDILSVLDEILVKFYWTVFIFLFLKKKLNFKKNYLFQGSKIICSLGRERGERDLEIKVILK